MNQENQMPNTAIELNHCQFSYNHQALVINIENLKITQGEKIFLFGPSGYGKSTLLNLISGVLSPNKGELKVLGHDFSKLPQRKKDLIRGEKIGYIFQIFNLIPYLSVKENIILPCLVNKNRAGSNYEAEASALIYSLGLNGLENKKVTELSIGQQQRVACARALIGNPELIIADEPTSALDEKNTREFMELLLKTWEEKKFTLIFVSHDERLKTYFPQSLSLPEINKL